MIREQKIIQILLEHNSLRSSEIHELLLKRGESSSLITIKRALADMVSLGLLKESGKGRSSAYQLAILGRISADINEKEYCNIDPDLRFGKKHYDIELFSQIPSEFFSRSELSLLDQATELYRERTLHLTPAIEKRELERLIIELAWKSSKIEGNTYTLLDTELLILENKLAEGHSKDEAQMILNHKEAFTFVRDHVQHFKKLSRSSIEELHAIIVRELGVSKGLRQKPVGIIGSIYQPLDNVHQIREGLEQLILCIERMATPYGKALMALIGISYLQPFEDGNKRTARILANAILLANAKAPLSYRSVNESSYREATLVFYELNSITPFKKIFMEQYDFAARNYAVKENSLQN